MPLLLLVFVLASGQTDRKPPPPTPIDQTGTGIEVAVRWSGVSATPGCFFFSGPRRLGRDDQLGSTACVSPGSPARVAFGGAVFTGSTGGLTRRSVHQFHGEWYADERLDGALQSDGRLNGTYLYEECEAGKACPGRCAIRASVTFTPIGRCGRSEPRS